MKITLNNIHHYLMHRGVINSSTILDCGFIAKKLPDTRKLFYASTGYDHFFVKQIDENTERAYYRLQRDATCLHILNQVIEYKDIKPFVAQYHGYHMEYHSMVTSFFNNSSNLDDFYRKAHTLPDTYYKQIIKILNLLHRDTASLLPKYESLQFFPQEFPWILNLTSIPLKPKDDAQNGMEVTIQHIIRDERLRNILETARAPWKVSALIHGDIKFTNFLIIEDDNNPIKVIDWEYADVGDPLWDVAGLIQNIIYNKILFHFHFNELGYTRGDMELEIRTALPLVARIWNSYMTNNENTHIDPETALQVTLQYTMARLLQTAIELNQKDLKILVNSQRVMDTSIFLNENKSWIMEHVKRDNGSR